MYDTEDYSDEGPDKLDALKQILAELQNVVVAFSGGLDSTFLLKIALDTLGKDNVLAVTAASPTYPKRELEESQRLAEQLDANHLIIDSNELEDEDFTQNPPNRCYFCKKQLFTLLNQVAEENNIPYVIDGSNRDDLDDRRPGAMAAAELGVINPLKEANFTKEDIRYFSRKLQLPTANKPAFACLASRFPYGEEITEKKLSQVEDAEQLLYELGFEQFRLRHHGNVARIEVGENDFERVIKNKNKIIEKIKHLGFAYVTLDLQGYRTGSMNEAL